MLERSKLRSLQQVEALVKVTKELLVQVSCLRSILILCSTEHASRFRLIIHVSTLVLFSSREALTTVTPYTNH